MLKTGQAAGSSWSSETLSITKLSVMVCKGGNRDCVAKDILCPGHHGLGRYRNMAGKSNVDRGFSWSKH